MKKTIEGGGSAAGKPDGPIRGGVRKVGGRTKNIPLPDIVGRKQKKEGHQLRQEKKGGGGEIGEFLVFGLRPRGKIWSVAALKGKEGKKSHGMGGGWAASGERGKGKKRDVEKLGSLRVRRDW